MQYPPQQPPPYPQQPYPQQPYPQQGYGPPGYPPPKKTSTGLVVGIVVGVTVLLVGAVVALRFKKHADLEEKCTATCADTGRCYPASNYSSCSATNAADCRKSKSCREEGRCGLGSENCVAVSAQDCRVSTNCKEWGSCDLKGSSCIPTTTAHCTQSNACATKQRCELKSDNTYCTDPNEPSSSSSSSSSSSAGGVTFSCPSNCTYIGGGKCRCKRR